MICFSSSRLGFEGGGGAVETAAEPTTATESSQRQIQQAVQLGLALGSIVLFVTRSPFGAVRLT